MSNYNLSNKLIKKLNDDYDIDFMAFLHFLEKYNPSDFSTKYVYPRIIKNNNQHVIDLGEIFNFCIEDLDSIFTKESSLKLEIYKIMKLKNKVYEIRPKNDGTLHYNRLHINITFAIAPATGFFRLFKKDKVYKYLYSNIVKPYHFKNIYDFLLTPFHEFEIECSEDHIRSLNKEDFEKLMSVFDMIFI